jgi:hypothetical protein
MLAACVRFSADGTLRGPDNYVIARCLEGCWEVGGRMHRELECEGPVRVRVNSGSPPAPRLFGPFRLVRTSCGVLYGDDQCLHVPVPGHVGQHSGGITLTLEGALNAET